MADQSDEPDWVRDFRTGMQGFVDQLTHASHIAAAQAAMGWLYRSDLNRARDTLTKLPTDALQQVSVAATTLANLADEIANEAPSDAQ